MSGSVSATQPPRPVAPTGQRPRPPDQGPPPVRARSEQDGAGVQVDLSRQVQFLLQEEGLQSLRKEREREETRSLSRDEAQARPPPEEAEEVPRDPAELAAFAEGYVDLYHAQHPDLSRDEARDEVMELLRRRGAARPEPPPPPEQASGRRDATRRFKAHQLRPTERGGRLTRSV